MELVVRLIEAIVWPTIIVWLVALFRGDLRALLSRISKVKYGDAEAVFEDGVRQIEVSGERLPAPKKIDLVGEPLNEKEEYLNDLAQTSPRAAVLEAWLEVEKEVAAAAGHFELQTDDLTKVFRENSQLETLLPTFNRLRVLRNKAAHASSFYPEPETVRAYIRQSLLLKSVIRVSWNFE